MLAFYSSDAQTGKTIIKYVVDIYKKAWTSYQLLSVTSSGLAIYLPQCQDSKLQKPCLYDNRCEPSIKRLTYKTILHGIYYLLDFH